MSEYTIAFRKQEVCFIVQFLENFKGYNIALEVFESL